jgi:hypothetical protein
MMTRSSMNFGRRSTRCWRRISVLHRTRLPIQAFKDPQLLYFVLSAYLV